VPLFEYSGFDGRGRKVSGSIEAAGRAAVLRKLKEEGIHPTDLREESRAGRRRGLAWPGRGARVSTVALAAATRQLATLLGGGLALSEALSSVAAQIEHPILGKTLVRVREKVIQGESLHAALAESDRGFPPLFINMVEVGENSGTLDQVLQQLADFLEEQARMKARIRAALAYPVLMALVGSGVLAFLFTFVVPKVTRMLEDLEQALPWPTLLLIKSSDFMAAYWWLALAVLVAGGFFFRRWYRSPGGRMQLDRLSLRLALVGKLNLQIQTARLARTLGTLLQSGVPLLKALDIVKNLLANRVLRTAIEETSTAVREGEGLAGPLQRSGVFPPMLAQMAAVGEQSGQLEGMLFKVAEAYEHQVDLTLNSLLSLLEPIMILVMGSAVGFIVIAILLPIFQASQGLG